MLPGSAKASSMPLTASHALFGLTADHLQVVCFTIWDQIIVCSNRPAASDLTGVEELKRGQIASFGGRRPMLRQRTSLFTGFQLLSNEHARAGITTEDASCLFCQILFWFDAAAWFTCYACGGQHTALAMEILQSAAKVLMPRSC